MIKNTPCCSGIRYFALIGLLLFVATGFSFLQQPPTAVSMSESAQAFLKTLDEKQKTVAVMPFDSEQRVQWHFIPKDSRKGLQIKHMNDEQEKAALDLLRSALSQTGYDKARKIMSLEDVLNAFQKEGAGPIRDSERYYYTIFGDPKGDKPWGLSFEGHHLSMNFVVEADAVTSYSPLFYAANPTVVKTDEVESVAEGTRVLAAEEKIAFKLARSLTDEQLKKALIAEKSPKEIRGAGEANPPKEDPKGISVADLTEDQQSTVNKLIKVYVNNLPKDVAMPLLKAIEEDGMKDVYFAWAGATKPGIGHYYLLESPSFQIEFVNTQPDAMGNPASHIHCVLRNPKGDFAIPVN